jgi:hypothetical protein
MDNEDKKMALYMREAEIYLAPATKNYRHLTDTKFISAYDKEKTIEIVAKLLDKYFNRT